MPVPGVVATVDGCTFVSNDPAVEVWRRRAIYLMQSGLPVRPATGPGRSSRLCAMKIEHLDYRRPHLGVAAFARQFI